MARKTLLKPGERAGLPPAQRFEPKWGRSVGRLEQESQPTPPTNPGLASARLREAMVARLRQQGISDERVLQAMQTVPRHAFVDQALASRAYEDSALPIGHQQTISQPYVVARSLSLARAYLRPTDRSPTRALEVGGGCGYQAAVMALISDRVVSVERIESLHRIALRNCESAAVGELALANLSLRLGDGLETIPGEDPFDFIVLAAGMASVPEDLLRQLRPGGVLVAPLGNPQRLVVVQRPLEGSLEPRSFPRHSFDDVQFVPILRGVQL